MRTIGAGWGRTGTTSLAKALERLGAGPCLQMQTLWAHPELADVWNAHHDGADVDWAAALAGWHSIVDWLGSWQWETYARLWPEAPIVLSVRDPDDWYDSVRATIESAMSAKGRAIGATWKSISKCDVRTVQDRPSPSCARWPWAGASWPSSTTPNWAAWANGARVA